MRYSWETNGGSITGVGDTVTWIAPDREGEFTIIVTIDDGKGGQNAEEVSVTVYRPIETVTFNLVPDESGTVSSEGDKDTSKIMAGDNTENVGYHAFFSFDISQLKGKDIKAANLTFSTGNVVREPFDKIAGLRGLRLQRVRGEQGQLPDYGTEAYQLVKGPSVMWEPPTVIDVIAEVKSPLLTPKLSIHLQFEASFINKTNANRSPDYVRWSVVTLAVTYAEK